MPYLVYRIFSEKQLEYVDSHDDYRTAKASVREMRKALAEAGDSSHLVRMIHAKNQDEAERLLTEVREAPPMGDD
jgi:hypothetical protein